jgi:nicotinate phosphoribosyltransferase
VTHLKELYRPSLSLLTDLYQLTMAYAYWKSGTLSRDAVFHLFYRNNPFGGGYSVACGLARCVEFLEGFSFSADDLEYLATLRGTDEQPLFDAPFLDYLEGLRLECDLDAMPEGTVAFPYEPLVRVRGPILQAQLLETPLLNFLNFETLIASKAARLCEAAKGQPVLEFGLRRAHGIDGGLAASRASWVGGCTATSNVLAGRFYGIPVRGTHAHSWVMSYADEVQAFMDYAAAMPNNCILLVDTYDTIKGVQRAIEVGRQLRKSGHDLAGIRLDSGDLAYLSQQARRALDAAGFEKTVIVASNDLDEHIIASLKDQEAAIDVWGVGTRLATGHDDSALGGVYKLSAVREPGGRWQHRVKLSEQASKVSNPGIQQVRRYGGDEGFVADMIWDEDGGVTAPAQMIDPTDPTRQKPLASAGTSEELLIPVFREGRRVYDVPSAEQARERCRQQLTGFHAGVRRFVNPHRYPVGLEEGLYERRRRLMLALRGIESGAS